LKRDEDFIKLKAGIKKLCVVRDLLVVVLEVEKVLGKLGETPYEHLKEE
jgi:hypothetical protein